MPLDATDHARVQAATKAARNAGQRWARLREERAQRRDDQRTRPPRPRPCACCGVAMAPFPAAPAQTLPVCVACWRAYHALGSRGTDRPRYGRTAPTREVR